MPEQQQKSERLQKVAAFKARLAAQRAALKTATPAQLQNRVPGRRVSFKDFNPEAHGMQALVDIPDEETLTPQQKEVPALAAVRTRAERKAVKQAEREEEAERRAAVKAARTRKPQIPFDRAQMTEEALPPGLEPGKFKGQGKGKGKP